MLIGLPRAKTKAIVLSNHKEEKMDKPIISSLLDIDFYKFTMGQFIFLLYPEVRTKFAFTCRTQRSPLPAEIIPEGMLREELDHAMTLRVNRSDLHYLRGTNEYGKPMFQESYLDFFSSFSLPAYNLEYRGNEILLDFDGLWKESTYWETIALSIISELFYRCLIKKRGLTRFDCDLVVAEGRQRLKKKIDILKANPKVVFSCFGTRRRFSFDNQDYIVGILTEELPNQFRGTSNVLLSKKYGLIPQGTNAHELQMVIAGLARDNDEALRASPFKTLDEWWNLYDEGLSVILPDTFGSSFLFNTLPEKYAIKWKGFRGDSMDMIKFGEKQIAFYKKYGVDCRKKLFIPSDGLSVEEMVRIQNHLGDRIKVSSGWGTNLSNDLGFEPLSLVIKAVSADGWPLVKLPDNPAKAIGPQDEIARYKRVFCYDGGQIVECRY